MENLQTLETPLLMDMLREQTIQLMAIITGKEPGNVDQFKYDLAMIQAELNARHESKDNTTISDTGSEFTAPLYMATAVPHPGVESSTD